jgi:hypothetical protein
MTDDSLRVIYSPSALSSAMKAEAEAAAEAEADDLIASPGDTQGQFLIQLRLICSSGVFVCCTLGLSTLYFVVTGVQFWATEFLLKVVGAPYNECLGAFAGTSASAPVLGVVLGGIVVDKIGGYHGVVGARRTSLACCISAFFAVTSAVVGSFQTNFSLVLILVWLVLFFGGAIVPGATGLVLAAVPTRSRELSSAMMIFVTNIFGYVAGTMVPAIYMQWQVSIGVEYKLAVQRGWQLLLCWSAWAMLFFGAAALITSAGWARWWAGKEFRRFSIVREGASGEDEGEDGGGLRTRGFRNPKTATDGKYNKAQKVGVEMEAGEEGSKEAGFFLPPVSPALADKARKQVSKQGSKEASKETSKEAKGEEGEEVQKGKNSQVRRRLMSPFTEKLVHHWIEPDSHNPRTQQKKRRRRKGARKKVNGDALENDTNRQLFEGEGSSDSDDGMTEVLDQMQRMAASLQAMEMRQQAVVEKQEAAAQTQVEAAQRQEEMLRLIECRQKLIEKEQTAAANRLVLVGGQQDAAEAHVGAM